MSNWITYPSLVKLAMLDVNENLTRAAVTTSYQTRDNKAKSRYKKQGIRLAEKSFDFMDEILKIAFPEIKR